MRRSTIARDSIRRTGSGGPAGVASVTGTSVDNTDPLNPIVDAPTRWRNHQLSLFRYIWGMDPAYKATIPNFFSLSPIANRLYAYPALFPDAGVLQAILPQFLTAPGAATPGGTLIRFAIYADDPDTHQPSSLLYESPEFGDWTGNSQDLLLLPNLSVARNTILHYAQMCNAAFDTSPAVQQAFNASPINIGIIPHAALAVPGAQPDFSGGEGFIPSTGTGGGVQTNGIIGSVFDMAYAAGAPLPATFVATRYLFATADGAPGTTVPLVSYYFERD